MGNVTILDPWQSSNSVKFSAELEKELCIEHVLFGKKLEIVARRRDKNEYLFRILEEEKFAQVNLTWRGAVESDPFWPVTTIYDSFNDWVGKVMQQDHEIYGD
jgi:hypothetical protein